MQREWLPRSAGKRRYLLSPTMWLRSLKGPWKIASYDLRTVCWPQSLSKEKQKESERTTFLFTNWLLTAAQGRTYVKFSPTELFDSYTPRWRLNVLRGEFSLDWVVLIETRARKRARAGHGCGRFMDVLQEKLTGTGLSDMITRWCLPW